MQPSEVVEPVGEYRMNCASAGKGESLLLIHGSDHREDWHVWEPFLALTDSHSLLMPDLIGYGGSTRPEETPDHRAQAHALHDMLDRKGIALTDAAGSGWGAQIALELALEWPSGVRSLTLIAGAYDKSQLPRLAKLRKPTLIVYAEDDMITQQKAGYLLRDAIGTSRLEILPPVAHDPRHDFTISHRLQSFRPGELVQLVRRFLKDPESMLAEPPELENELRGMALRKEEEPKGGGAG